MSIGTPICGEMQIFVDGGSFCTTKAPQGSSPATSVQKYPPRQSSSDEHVSMQKVRALGESLPGFSQAGTAEDELLNMTQMASPAGQLVSEQLARVQ